MAMGIGGGSRAEINVTPMIDVLLVLIIIFLVIQPSLTHGLKTDVPQPPDGKQRLTPREDIVIEVARDRKVRLNREPVEIAALAEQLRDLWKRGANRVVFVKGSRELDFAEIAEVIDIVKGAGYDRVALMTR